MSVLPCFQCLNAGYGTEEEASEFQRNLHKDYARKHFLVSIVSRQDPRQHSKKVHLKTKMIDEVDMT